jgi:hypothetical protein
MLDKKMLGGEEEDLATSTAGQLSFSCSFYSSSQEVIYFTTGKETSSKNAIQVGWVNEFFRKLVEEHLIFFHHAVPIPTFGSEFS